MQKLLFYESSYKTIVQVVISFFWLKKFICDKLRTSKNIAASFTMGKSAKLT